MQTSSSGQREMWIPAAATGRTNTTRGAGRVLSTTCTRPAGGAAPGEDLTTALVAHDLAIATRDGAGRVLGTVRAVGFFRYYFNIPQEDIVYNYQTMASDTAVARLLATPEGKVMREFRDFQKDKWNIMRMRPTEVCHYYARCIPNGLCDNGTSVCLQGFEDWELKSVHGDLHLRRLVARGRRSAGI